MLRPSFVISVRRRTSVWVALLVNMWLRFGKCLGVCFCNHMRCAQRREWVANKSTWENKGPLTLDLFSKSAHAGSMGWIIYLCMAGETTQTPSWTQTLAPQSRRKEQNSSRCFLAMQTGLRVRCHHALNIPRGMNCNSQGVFLQKYLPDGKWIMRNSGEKKVAREGRGKEAPIKTKQKIKPWWKPPNSPSKSRAWRTAIRKAPVRVESWVFFNELSTLFSHKVTLLNPFSQTWEKVNPCLFSFFLFFFFAFFVTENVWYAKQEVANSLLKMTIMWNIEKSSQV